MVESKEILGMKRTFCWVGFSKMVKAKDTARKKFGKIFVTPNFF